MSYYIVLECEINSDGTRGPFKKVKSGFDESKLNSEVDYFNKTHKDKYRYVKLINRKR